MVFSSLLFLFLYLPVVLAVYYIVPRRWRNVWLFAVNLVFYGWGEPVYILLMLFSISFNYAAGLMLERFSSQRAKAKRVLIADVVLNLALLCFFKYYDLFAETLNLIPGVRIPTLGLTLPIGISFYTFQTMSYPIDVYRSDTKVQKNYVSFGTFVALFPQLIAGPIVRYRDIADQLSFRATDREQFASGVRRFVVGLGKKVLIANNIGMLWDIYKSAAPADLTVLGAWMGILAFTLQIYFDFSGYSDMAIGLGRMLGFEFLENFNYPYISRSVSEFWRRWHISLATWFREYVYIPLGGNRKGLARQLVNILIVWMLTGLWHGASFNFLLWGGYYALLLVAEKCFLNRILERTPSLIRLLYTLLAVNLGWVLFYFEDLAQVGQFAARLFTPSALDAQGLGLILGYLPLLVVGAVASTPLGSRLNKRWSDSSAWRWTRLALSAGALALCVAALASQSYNPFIYFRF